MEIQKEYSIDCSDFITILFSLYNLLNKALSLTQSALHVGTGFLSCIWQLVRILTGPVNFLSALFTSFIITLSHVLFPQTVEPIVIQNKAKRGRPFEKKSGQLGNIRVFSINQDIGIL